MSLDAIDGYPWFLNKPVQLEVNEQPVRTRFSATEWADHWRPFLTRLRAMFEANLPKRFLVAIAGPPGSGKSVLAEQLYWLVHRGFFHKMAYGLALPMDGFHFPNQYLETHTRKLADGSEIPLSSVKGQPDTIDVANLKKKLQLLVQRPHYVDWPGYSRHTHDIIEDKYRVHENANIIFIEGNYLLLDRGPFHGIPELFNLRIYIEAPAVKVMANLMERHMKGGKTMEQAKDWVKRIDLPNARIAESTRAQADVRIERDHDDDLTTVTWKNEPEASTITPKQAAAPVSTTAAAAVAPGSPVVPPAAKTK